MSDSPMPVVRSVTVTAVRPRPRSARRGMTQPVHIGCISRGGPGRATTIRPSGRSTHQPGAVPRSLGIEVAEGISHACLRLALGKGTPRRSKSARSHASRSASTVGCSPTAAAMASRVRSSGVGPRPPVRTTRSDRSSAPSIADRRAGSSSGIDVVRRTTTPASVRPRARSPAFVSRVSPVVSSEPTDRTSAVCSARIAGSVPGATAAGVSSQGRLFTGTSRVGRAPWERGRTTLLAFEVASPPDGGPVDDNATAAPGLIEQVRATIAAGRRLLRAHVELAKAELGEIMDAVKRVLGLALGALALVFAALLLIFIGGLLFLGEWLFGSLGWGVLLGSLLLIDLAVMAALAAVSVPGGRLGRDLGLAVILGLVVAIVLEYDLAHSAWVSLGDSLLPGIDSGWRAVIVAVV